MMVSLLQVTLCLVAPTVGLATAAVDKNQDDSDQGNFPLPQDQFQLCVFLKHRDRFL